MLECRQRSLRNKEKKQLHSQVHLQDTTMMNLISQWILSICLMLAITCTPINGHGRLLEPPSRASMWRFGYNTPKNYDDNQLFCGGFNRQWNINGGKCGVCGDPYDGRRDHEAGGKYATGIIVRHYSEGQTINVNVQITASHRGYFEFRLCPHNNPSVPITQQCLDQYLLRQPSGSRKVYELGHPTNYTIQLMLPPGVTCSQCVLQWKYNAGNSYGCEGGKCCVGCGHQEQFYGCSDASIGTSQSGTISHQLSPVAQTANSQSSLLNYQSAQIQQLNTFHQVLTAQIQSGSGSQDKQCRATAQYRAIYQYADQFCVVQCRKGNCPSYQFCNDACRHL